MAAPAIQTTMQRLHIAGLRVTLTPEKGLKASPASSMTDAMRALIVAHKVEIVAYLSAAANDPAPTPAPDKLRAASLALDAVVLAAGLAADPDRWSYPHSTAMNTAEIDRFTARLARFTDRGVILSEAERLADLLVIRDRERDDRALCLECTHLQRAGRCGNWQAAGVAIRARDAFMPVELVRQLQRCDGFTGALPAAVSGNQGVTHE